MKDDRKTLMLASRFGKQRLGPPDHVVAQDDAQVPGGDYSLRNAVDVGLGMNPALVGRGLSHGFLAAILDWGRQCFEPDYFRATVAGINLRSQGMFSRAGFFIIQRFRPPDNDIHEFLVMIHAEPHLEQRPA